LPTRERGGRCLLVVAVYVQLALSMLLLRREFDRRLRWAPVEAAGQRAIA
jgi:hypothetical protein